MRQLPSLCRLCTPTGKRLRPKLGKPQTKGRIISTAAGLQLAEHVLTCVYAVNRMYILGGQMSDQG